jgi:hypothetical protein
MSDFKELIDADGLDPAEEARLRRVHELLVQAGPPPDLPPALEQAPEEQSAEIVQFPLLPRRRWGVAAVAAATLALLAFGGGYLTGHTKSSDSAFTTSRVVPMHGQGDALALLRLSDADSVGNWPMQLEVTGLPKQQDQNAYYELWLTKDGKPVEQCGTFRVHGKTTRIRFTVPYSLEGVDGWVITEQTHGAAQPGPVVLST